ncbi:MAG: type II toxin-antitoxin system VapC family toxin [Terracidiphilus sp.]
MNIIADTNVLVRAAVEDDPTQTSVAKRILKEADPLVVGRHALCEFAWVLSRTYKFSRTEIRSALRKLLDAENVVFDGATTDAGLKVLEAGADFADGVIAYEGRWLGGEMFVSFDKKAVAALEKQGQRVKLLR